MNDNVALQSTPGPWFNDPTISIADWDGLPCVTDKHRLAVAQVIDDGHTDEECEANACLIAAAPELYEGLVALVKAVNTNELAAAMACHEIVAFSNVADALKLALPAIAKARGEPSSPPHTRDGGSPQ